ncbi:MAG: 4-hydroxy-tetrahydrodipicolinate synthase [Clostridium sp.]|uniref:4-hydroxy-tetrahydrodipicolinate synthase n=1 Tax=Clostridium sp. TaxID=1506 RepID=UPI003EE76AC2
MKKFKGNYIPMITPFNEKDEVDIDKLKYLVRDLIENQKADGLVLCGTTGEASSLSDKEFEVIIKVVISEVNEKVPILAGVGSNNVDKTIRRIKIAEKYCVDGLLVVSPYYIRPNQEQLYNYFKNISSRTDLPIVLYDIPARCGVRLENSIIFRLAKDAENIVGIKDATGDVSKTIEMIKYFYDINREFYVFSGEDLLSLPLLSVGAVGTIAASANIIGYKYSRLIKLIDNNELVKAKELNFEIYNITKLLFLEPNPTAIKESYNLMNIGVGNVRLPLTNATEDTRELLKNELGRLNLYK